MFKYLRAILSFFNPKTILNPPKYMTNEDVDKIIKELNVSSTTSSAVYYFRTRARWTQTLETELIRLHKEGNPPNIFTFGY